MVVAIAGRQWFDIYTMTIVLYICKAARCIHAEGRLV